MKKYLFLASVLFTSWQAFSQSSLSSHFNKIYSFALQENITKALALLDSIPNDQLAEEQRLLKQKYYHRFRTQDEQPEYNTTDSVLIGLLQHYRQYWKQTLLHPQQAAQFEKQLEENIGQFLTAQQYKNDGSVQGDLYKNFTQHLKLFLTQKGYYSATGKIGSLFDLLIWPKEVKTVYDVKLPTGRAATTVVFMVNTISLGWEEFATFGKYYPGGWATKEELYCVQKAYDTTSENFKVSYLKHEGQHFADYLQFPKLTGGDLEYRAKLTELCYADQTLYNVIGNFIRNASYEGRMSHPFGNYCVIRDLSRQLFQQDFVTDMEQWKKVPASRIRKESLRLLKAHTKGLRKAGAQTVSAYVQ